jgi:hypothetical protein
MDCRAVASFGGGRDSRLAGWTNLGRDLVGGSSFVLEKSRRFSDGTKHNSNVK